MVTITNWDSRFETANTRKRQRLGYISCETGCDSRGYRMLMREGSPGVMALGVFQALCQTMGTFPRDVRATGEFRNSDGTSMELADLWEITRIQEADLRQALALLRKVGWISLITQQSATGLPPVCHPPAANVPQNSGFVQVEVEGEVEVQGKVEVEVIAPTSAEPESKPEEIDWDHQEGFRGISKQDLIDWGQAYPACAINRQIAAANQWLKANPAKARKKLWRKFLTGWLSRAQEKGGDIASNRPAAQHRAEKAAKEFEQPAIKLPILKC